MKGIIRRIIAQGNSLMISIPPKLLKEKNLKKGDYIRLDKITKVKIQYNDVKETSRQRKLPPHSEVKK